MKKILGLISIISITSMLAINALAVTMYAPDGRTSEVDERDVEAWRNVGWYDVPVTVMYSLDGRTAVAAASDVEAWKSVGWYEGPVTVMYAPDGRTAVVANSDIEAWKSVGWYNGVIVTLYAPDGRTMSVGSNELKIWKNSGWYDVPVAIMYAPDGRTTVVPQTAVTAWKNVGWYASSAEAQAAAAKLKGQAVSKFKIGQQVRLNLFVVCKFGTVKDINSDTGKIKVYWERIIDGSGYNLNEMNAMMFFGLYSEEWQDADSLTPMS